MPKYVIVGWNPVTVRLSGPDIVTGLFTDRAKAAEFMELLKSTTTGKYAVLKLHEPLDSTVTTGSTVGRARERRGILGGSKNPPKGTERG